MGEIVKLGEDIYKMHTKIVELKTKLTSNFLELGARLKMVKEEKMYADMGHDTFESYLGSPELGFSKSVVTKLIAIYKKFCLDYGVSPGTIEDIHWTKLREILPVANQENYIEWIDKARDMSRSDLIIEVDAAVGKDKKECDPGQHEWEDEIWEKCIVCGKKRRKEDV